MNCQPFFRQDNADIQNRLGLTYLIANQKVCFLIKTLIKCKIKLRELDILCEEEIMFGKAGFVAFAILFAFQPECFCKEKAYEIVNLRKNNGIFGFEEVPYTLGPGDVISVSVQGHPEFSGTFTVSPQGVIQYQYLGDIDVKGLTKKELARQIAGLLAEYIHMPKVVVNIEQFKSKFVYIMGEVNSPGKYPMQGSALSVRDAIVAAGLTTRSAGMRGARLIRPTKEGKVYVRKIDLCKILYEGQLDENYNLQPGDIIYVPTLTLTKVGRAISYLVDPFYKAAVAVDIANGDDD